MATYKGIKGVKVVTKATDPTASEADATVWYNSTGNALKYSVAGTGAWAAGGGLNTARSQIPTSVMAPSSATLCAGGSTAPGEVAVVEKYDGTSLTEVNNINTARRNAGGCGTVNTAVVIAGGQSPGVTAICELYDGTSWTEVNNLNQAKTSVAPGGAGSSTAGLLAGGSTPSITNQTESWDGTCWTELNNLNTARQAMGVVGTQTASIAGGGYGPSTYAGEAEVWDGTSWSEVNNLNTARGWLGAAGTTTSAVGFAGQSATSTQTALTETWDGTSWTEVADLATARQSIGGGGTTQGAAIAVGGAPGYLSSVEVWSDPVYAIKTVTVS